MSMPRRQAPMNPMNKRYAYLFIIVGSLLALTLVATFRSLAEGTRQPGYLRAQADIAATRLSQQQEQQHGAPKAQVDLHGHVVAPKLGNETAKAELGRAAWKLFHTTFARFPEKPTHDESVALESYIYLFQRLYPCGECASHFGEILKRFPPQVTSRNNAAAWGCHVHNEVNRSLDKPDFDCSNIGDFYDCGCKEDDPVKEVEEDE